MNRQDTQDVDGTPLRGSPLSRRRFLQGTGQAVLLALGGNMLAACGSREGSSPTTIRIGQYAGWIGKNEFVNFTKGNPEGRVEEVVISVDADRIAKLATDPSAVDIMLLRESDVQKAIDLNVVQEINLDQVPNYKYIAEQFKFGYAAPKKARAVATDYGRTGFGYRTDMVEEKLTSWADIWKVAPKYSGKITLLDFPLQTLRSTLIMLGHSASSQNESEIRQAGEKLIELKPYLQSFTETNHTNGLIDGSVAIAMDWDYDMFNAVQENPNIKWVDPEEGMLAYLDTWIAINKSEHLDIVWDFMNFHFAPKNYAHFVNTTGTASCMPAAREDVKAKLANSPVLYPNEDVLDRIEWEEPLGEAQSIYNQVWSTVKAA